MSIFYKLEEQEQWIECNTLEDLTKLYNYDNIYALNVNNNRLTVLPTLPKGLVKLDCSYNNLTILQTLPNSLTLLDCNHNKLTVLPTLPDCLNYLDCQDNLLQLLPTLPNSLTYTKFHNNPVAVYIKEKCDNNLKIYYRENEIFATKLVRWYLDCRENPEYLFCRTRLDREYNALMEEDMDGIMA